MAASLTIYAAMGKLKLKKAGKVMRHAGRAVVGAARGVVKVAEAIVVIAGVVEDARTARRCPTARWMGIVGGRACVPTNERMPSARPRGHVPGYQEGTVPGHASPVTHASVSKPLLASASMLTSLQ